MTLDQAGALTIYLLAFAVAAGFHAYDLIRWGWLPYDFAPWPLNLFWTALTLLDPLVILLLVTGRRRSGLALAAGIMAADVSANAYALFALGYSEFARSLPLQGAFFGFVIGTLPFLWPRPRPGGR